MIRAFAFAVTRPCGDHEISPVRRKAAAWAAMKGCNVSRMSRVRDLKGGAVISLPDGGLVEPALITAISESVGRVRFILLSDVESGEPLQSRFVLGLDREVRVHDVTVAHHHYRNKLDALIEVQLGRRVERVDPGDALHYTGTERPDIFPESDWEHSTQPVVVHSDERSLF